MHWKHKLIRVSPDGIFSCDCHEEKCLVECKAPLSAAGLSIIEALAKGTLPYIKVTPCCCVCSENMLELKPMQSLGRDTSNNYKEAWLSQNRKSATLLFGLGRSRIFS